MAELGIALIAVGLILVLAEAHMSAGGLIGAFAGLAAIGGVTLLLLAAGAGAGLVLMIAVCAAALTFALLITWRRRILRPLQTRPRTGREALIGHVGVVRSLSGSHAQVFLDGSLWRAEPDPGHEQDGLHEGEQVIVERVNGLTLRVRRAEEWELNP
jgi:membrane protein implicated in regulation of membrane protease activity